MSLKNFFKSNGDSHAATDSLVALKEKYYTALKRKWKADNDGDADQIIESDRELQEIKTRVAVAENVQKQAKQDEFERMRDKVPGLRENLRRALEQATTDAIKHLEVGCRLLHAAGFGSVEEAVKRAVAFSGEIPAVALGNGQAAADAYLVEHPLPDIAAQREGLQGIESVLDGSAWAISSASKRQLNRALRERLTPKELAERADLDRWARRR